MPLSGPIKSGDAFDWPRWRSGSGGRSRCRRTCAAHAPSRPPRAGAAGVAKMAIVSHRPSKYVPVTAVADGLRGRSPSAVRRVCEPRHRRRGGSFAQLNRRGHTCRACRYLAFADDARSQYRHRKNRRLCDFVAAVISRRLTSSIMGVTATRGIRPGSASGALPRSTPSRA